MAIYCVSKWILTRSRIKSKCYYCSSSCSQEKAFEYASAPQYYEYLQNRMELFFRPFPKKDEPRKPDEGFKLKISKRWSYDQVAAKVGAHLNVDPFKIRFWANPTGGDVPKAIVKRVAGQTVQDIVLASFYNVTFVAFWYEILDVSILELETKRLLKVTWLDANLKEGVRSVIDMQELNFLAGNFGFTSTKNRLGFGYTCHGKRQTEAITYSYSKIAPR